MRLGNGLIGRAVRGEAAPGKFRDGRNGLILVVGQSASASWIMRYMHEGRRHDLGLGPLRHIGLAQARRLAASKMGALKGEGLDPLAERSAARRHQRLSGVTFRQAADAYVTAHRAKWKNQKHADQWLATLSSYAYPTIGSTRVGEVSTDNVLQILQAHWQRVPETMSRLRGRLETVLGFAKAKGWRQGENVAAWRGHLQVLLPPKSMVKGKTKHHEAVPLGDLPAVFARLRARKTVGAQAAAFAILTAARAGEASGALWPEIDFEAAAWMLPPERYKTHHMHMVPLSPTALEILRERLAVRRKGDERIFPTRGAGGPSDSTMRTELRRATGRKDSTATMHGTSRAGLDGFVNTRTSYPTKLVDWALGHAPGGLTVQAYRRECLFPQRTPMMRNGQNFCFRKLSGRPLQRPSFLPGVAGLKLGHSLLPRRNSLLLPLCCRRRAISRVGFCTR